MFEGDGHLGGKVKLGIDPEGQPAQLPKCTVPLAMMEALKEELTKKGHY